MSTVNRVPSVSAQWLAGVLLVFAAATTQAAALTLGIVDLPNNAPVLIAEREGFFAAEGLDLKFIHCVNGRRCVQHLVDGQAQMVMTAETALVLAAAAGHRFDVVATVARSSTGIRLIARSDRGVRAAADLTGRRLGFLPATNAHYYADTFLLLHGVDPAGVQSVRIDNADPTGPLLRGEIDAAAYYQPHASIVLSALGGKAVVLPLPRVYTVTMNLISQPAERGVSDDDLRRVLRAMQRGQRLLAAEPQRMKTWLSGYLRLEPKLLDVMLDEQRFGFSLDEPLVQTLEAQARWAIRSKLVPGQVVPDFLSMIREAPLSAVQPRAVKVVK